MPAAPCMGFDRPPARREEWGGNIRDFAAICRERVDVSRFDRLNGMDMFGAICENVQL